MSIIGADGMGILEKFFRPRETSAQRAEWLQGQVGVAAQRAALEVQTALRRAARSFEAAETPAWTDSWPTHAANINEDLARQLATLRARSRAQARNNEWAIGYLLKLDDNVLGENGIRYQSRLKKQSGDADTVANDRLEGAFSDWGRDCDVSGLSWREVESVALEGLARDGELLYRHRPGYGRYRYQIQMLDPALLDVTVHREFGGNRVRMGVEINDDGRPVAYWLKMAKIGDSASDLVAVGQHVRVPANEIVHRFIKHEVGQLRGYPWLSAGARRLWLLHEFEESAAVASNNAAKRQGFFYAPATAGGEAPPGFADKIVSQVLDSAKAAGKVLTPDEIQAVMAAAEKYSTTMPGQFDTLPYGYQFEKYESDWPNIEADTYVKAHIRGWSSARGMSYVTLGNDLEAVNYSSAQVGIVGERDHCKRLQAMVRDWLSHPVLTTVMPYLVLATPRLEPSRVDRYLEAATWQPRRWQPVDPVKAATANDTNLKNKLTSRRRIILERGDDPDEILAEIQAEEQRFGPWVSGSQSVAVASGTSAAAEDDPASPAKFLA